MVHGKAFIDTAYQFLQRSGLFDANGRFSWDGLIRLVKVRRDAFVRGLVIGGVLHVLIVAVSGLIATTGRPLLGLVVPFAHPDLGVLSFLTFPVGAVVWTLASAGVAYAVRSRKQRRLGTAMAALVMVMWIGAWSPTPKEPIQRAVREVSIAVPAGVTALLPVAAQSFQNRPSDEPLEGDINADFRPQGGMGWFDWLMFLLKNAPWLIPQSLLIGLLTGLTNALSGEDKKLFDPPGGLPEKIPPADKPESKHPECDALYARLKDAIIRYRKAQQARDEVRKRLDKAYLIHLHNQLVTAWKLGIDVGSLAGGGVDGARMAGGTLGRGAADLAEDIRRARESLPGYAADRIRARLSVIDASLDRLAGAQKAFDALEIRRNTIAAQLWSEWLKKHPGIPTDTIHPFALRGTGLKRPRSQHEIDLIELETNPIARQSILDDIARQGYATPQQRAELARLEQVAEQAQSNQLLRESQALADGWDPDFLTYARDRHPDWDNLEGQLDLARAELRSAEQAAPPNLVAERERLRKQLAGLQNAADDTATNPGLGRGGGRPTDTNPTGAVGRPPREPKTQFWEVPKPPQWIRNIRDGITGTVGQLLSPVARLWRWAFVGEDQSPEEIGRILQEGMDTIDRLTAEFDARQGEIDRIRAEVQHMREGLERCNKSWR